MAVISTYLPGYFETTSAATRFISLVAGAPEPDVAQPARMRDNALKRQTEYFMLALS